jgi:MFS family permease
MQTLRELRRLPRNVWAVSLTSFLTDISTDMVINLAPLFLANVLGVRTGVIGLIEGVAESVASLLKVFSGWLSDRLGARKWLAVAGYAISALAKPFYYGAASWGTIAAARWADRVGKGIRTAPRDALIADSITPEVRGLAFGFQRAADTAGALLGLAIACFVIWRVQATAQALDAGAFQTVVLISLIPGFLAVLALALGTRDVPRPAAKAGMPVRLRGLGKPFLTFLLIAGLFDLGNSSDAFLVLRAQERGASVLGVLGMLLVFNAVYTLVSTPAGSLSDRVGRRRVIVAGWLLYAVVYLGFALARGTPALWGLFALYGVYYGLSYGTAKALVADLVPDVLRGTAYGAYNAWLGILDLPASLIAGLLWQGWGGWAGFGPSAPFYFGAAMALLAVAAFLFWNRER